MLFSTNGIFSDKALIIPKQNDDELGLNEEFLKIIELLNVYVKKLSGINIMITFQMPN